MKLALLLLLALSVLLLACEAPEWANYVICLESAESGNSTCDWFCISATGTSKSMTCTRQDVDPITINAGRGEKLRAVPIRKVE